MTTKVPKKKYTYDYALSIAHKIWDKIVPSCNRIAIAGSIRREKREVSDIEIVCTPRSIESPDGLFNTKNARVDSFVNTINKWEKVKGNPVDGKYTRRIHETGTEIDFFIVNELNWGTQLLLRTGPKNFNKQMIEKARNSGYVFEGGYLKEIGTKEIVPVYEEEFFFHMINQKYIQPFARM